MSSPEQFEEIIRRQLFNILESEAFVAALQQQLSPSTSSSTSSSPASNPHLANVQSSSSVSNTNTTPSYLHPTLTTISPIYLPAVSTSNAPTFSTSLIANVHSPSSAVNTTPAQSHLPTTLSSIYLPTISMSNAPKFSTSPIANGHSPSSAANTTPVQSYLPPTLSSMYLPTTSTSNAPPSSTPYIANVHSVSSTSATSSSPTLSTLSSNYSPLASIANQSSIQNFQSLNRPIFPSSSSSNTSPIIFPGSSFGRQKKQVKSKPERFPSYHRKIILLPCPNIKNLAKAAMNFLMENGFGYPTSTWEKSWNIDQLLAFINKLLPILVGKGGVRFCERGIGGAIIHLTFPPDRTLDARILFHATTTSIFLEPVDSLMTGQTLTHFLTLNEPKDTNNKRRKRMQEEEEFNYDNYDSDEFLGSPVSIGVDTTETVDASAAVPALSTAVLASTKSTPSSVVAVSTVAAASTVNVASTIITTIPNFEFPSTSSFRNDLSNESSDHQVYEDENGVLNILVTDPNAHVSGFYATDDLFDHFKSKFVKIPQTFQLERGNLLHQTIGLFKNGGLIWNTDILIKFKDEGGVDAGGVAREYMDDLMEELRNCGELFEGGSEGKNLKYVQKSVKSQLYCYAGQIIVLSLFNGGPGPHCFSPILFKSLTSDLDETDFVKENIADPHSLYAIKLAEATTTLLELNQVIAEHQLFAVAGIEQQLSFHNNSLEATKAAVVREAIVSALQERVEKPLKQLKEGLEPFMPDLLENTELLKPVFVAGKLPLSAERLFKLLKPSPRSEAKKSDEDIVRHWRRFLTECETGNSLVALTAILKFATGLRHLPPGGLFPIPSCHIIDKSLPEAATCYNQISIPSILSYPRFKDSLETGITGAEGLIAD